MAIDWTNLYEKYKGQWVALKDDRITVISSGRTVKETLKQARDKGLKNPILFHVPEEIVAYVGIVYEV